ncbi:hypothetical protein EV44_g3290 [Erysiphe necator]|uniref:Uncharacterized protein n=1 Tax=Uncinula necator TaxID=52586 RepID=A0A0B1P0Z2_UNCNE|nr:hypothetical protein EV44_g3290 [Erysiphe necator]
MAAIPDQCEPNNEVIANNNAPDIPSVNNENLSIEITNTAREIAVHEDNTLNITCNTNTTFCKGCRKNCHPSLFYDDIRNKSFKQCSDCRRRVYARRHPEMLQPQTNSEHLLPTGMPINLPSYNAVNLVTDTAPILCRKCKKTCPPESFANSSSNSLYATCLDCRSQQHERRYPTVFEPTSLQHPINNNDDLYDVSDDDVVNLAADIGRFELEEVEVFNGPVPEEAPLGDDPIFLYSQLQSREFRNHDEIQRRLQADEEINGINVLEPDSNIDPFLEEIPQPGNDLYEDNNQLENLDRNNLFIEETPRPRNNEIAQPQNLLPIDPFLVSYPPPQAEDVIMIDDHQPPAERSEQVQAPPRRIPTWLAAPGARRLDPAGYLSRYRSTMAAHDLGEMNSICPSCKALHFSSERVKGRTGRSGSHSGAAGGLTPTVDLGGGAL